MTARELRLKYLRFFESKGHTVYPSGSLIPYDVTGKLDESLLFNGAGMVQFKPFFRGTAEPPNRRLTTAQKCVRTGDIESVGNESHLTFFEMLGNFSFGDYFKREAIAYSWEFLTSPEWLGLDPKRLSFTVFHEDEEAFDCWAEHLVAAGIEPASRVFRLGEETNYWPAGAFSSGPPGPCGPNSEMFYWTPTDVPPPGTPYTLDDWLRDDEAKNWLEIWNDVFIQYEWKGRLRNPDRPGDGYVKEGMPELPFKSIDTGMGLERTIIVLTGKKSVYESDLFAPIMDRIVQLRSSAGSVAEMQAAVSPNDLPESELRAVRIIADHIRTACFCIADGILPSNTGRGYVLRRLIRRAVLKGLRVLGFERPFFHLVYEGVVEAMGEHYHELVDRRDVIVETLLNEENLFRRTIAAGSDMLQDHLDALGRSAAGSTKVLGGAVAFKLYDTYGFPLEVTKELCEEAGVEVDVEGYEVALKQAQERSRGSSDMDTVYGAGSETLVVVTSANATPQSRFVGYGTTEWPTEIVQISPRFGADGLTTGEFQICLAETPFYAESGGQVGDTGVIEAGTFRFAVSNTWKELGLIWHDATLEALPLEPGTPEDQIRQAVKLGATHPVAGLTPEEITEILESALFFVPVVARVDAARRRRITRNHSATHLLHAALRAVLGKHVTQAGSLVAPDHLRFDFTHGKAMTDGELEQVEALVNEEALKGLPVVTYEDIPLAEARARGAMALFGEKYGDRVRMVEMGEFSRELCGGCHVRATSEVGLFKIIHESSAASGVRRIEAISGEAAYEHVREQSAAIRTVASLLRSTPHELPTAVEKTLDALREERRKRERAEQLLAKGGGEKKANEYVQLGFVRLWTPKFEGIDPKIAASAVDDAVAANPDLVVVAAVIEGDKVRFIAKVGKGALPHAHAGNLAREAAQVTGGNGGGRPDFATAGGTDLSKVDEALTLVRRRLG